MDSSVDPVFRWIISGLLLGLPGLIHLAAPSTAASTRIDGDRDRFVTRLWGGEVPAAVLPPADAAVSAAEVTA